MKKGRYLFTSESVAEGHPDKVCDRISDAVLDAFLTHDPQSRVAVETLATTNRIVLAGEVRGPRAVTAEMINEVARAAVKEIGYEQDGFHWRTAEVQNHIHEQSADIAQGVDAVGNKDEGAGDQGIMFGYACTETDQFMPAPIFYAHNILKSLAEGRHSGAEPGLGPDAKSQVTLEYEDNKPLRATSVVVSTQHDERLDQDEVREIVRPHVVNVLPEGWMCEEAEFYVNPTGRFVVGGPDGDCGLTGRKIIVDTYGGAAPHGGGAFSGKDPTKVDRSAAYAARYL
ncbi:MAG: methionine adenosyltransferase, partial [Alphaproteobacteria bacterium]